MKERVKDLIKDKNLRTKLENIIRKVGEEFEPGNVGDTLQGFQHFETVDKNLANIIAKTGKDIEFSDMELFLLGASPYLHDLFKPSSAWGFLSHGGKVMEAVTDKPELYGLDDRAEAIAIGWVSAAHSGRSLDNTEWGRVPEKYAVGSEEVDLRKLAAIFLLADTLDTTTSRAPEMLSHIHYPEKFPDEKTEGKWMARQAITGWYIKGEKIVLQAYPENSDEREAVLGAKTLMERDLSEAKPLLKSLGFPCELELEMEVIFLKEKAIAEIQESRPFKGMDFYDESDTGLFKGRKGDVGRVEDHIYAYPITLLAGSSGVGKTSLIHAGLFPGLKISGWECIYLRPFDDPSKMVESIKKMYGVEAESLAEAFRNLDEKLKKKILVVVDQFEEVLNWHAEILEELVLDFCSIHGLENPKFIVVLRSDALCNLNRKIFKKVMTNGFPTVELGGLGGEGAREALNAGFKAGKMVLHPSEFIDEILNDLIEISPFDEIYPPYLQMVGEELCKHADEKHKLILKDKYYELGRAREIVAKYLFRKLEEFEKDRENAIKILKSLVSYAGGKAQKSVSEIEAETVIPEKELEELLRRLVNERMVRKLDATHYEIIHDHFGKLVNEEFVDEEERHIKYLREQLNAAIAAFEQSKALMHGVILAELYHSRKKIPVDEAAYPALMATWCAHQFPVWYWLKNVGNMKIIEMTIGLCEHPKEDVKVGASNLLTTALVTVGDKNEVRKFYAHENRVVRRAAVQAISTLESREDLPEVRELLNDKEEDVRRAAVQAISTLGSREDVPLVKELFNDEDWNVRMAALETTLKIVSREDLPLVRALLRDKEENVRMAAIKAFSKLVSREDLPLARELLKDKFRYVRMAAVQAISTLGSREDVPLVRERLNDEARDVRKAAVQAISTLGSREDLPLVRERLNDEARDVRKAAAEAFSKLLSREDLPLVRGRLNDEDWEVRAAAVKALAELGSREDLPLVRMLLREKYWEVRMAAAEAFSKLVSREDLLEVRELLNDEDWEVRMAAAEAFFKLVSREDLPLVRELFRDKEENVRMAAVQAISTLGSREDVPLVRERLNDEARDVRKAAVQAISTLGSREDLPLVRERLNDEARDVQRAAVWAITNLGGEKDLDDLAKLVVETSGAREEPMEALGKLDWKLYSPYSLSEKHG